MASKKLSATLSGVVWAAGLAEEDAPADAVGFAETALGTAPVDDAAGAALAGLAAGLAALGEAGALAGGAAPPHAANSAATKLTAENERAVEKLMTSDPLLRRFW
jgi:hypothetical protein